MMQQYPDTAFPPAATFSTHTYSATNKVAISAVLTDVQKAVLRQSISSVHVIVPLAS